MSHVCNETHTTPPTLIYKFLYKKKLKKIFFTHYVIHISFLIFQNRRPVPSIAIFSSKTPHNYSTLSNNDNFQLDPWWVTGLVDGEGCFHVSITENKNYKHGWRVRPSFVVGLNKQDQPLLQKILRSLGVGKIHKHVPQSLQLEVTSRKDLKVLMKFFKKHKLIYQKQGDSELWCEVIGRIERG